MSNVSIHAKKRFGQNFLKDESILNKIVDASGASKDTLVIEIGPGLGALTTCLCKKCGFVLAYEIDDDLIPILKKNLLLYKNVEIIHQDILKANIKEDILKYKGNFKEIRVVANLPYYITTPILMELLSKSLEIESITVMMQLELADRICGKPSTKDYNALSVLIAYKALAKKIMKVSRNCFSPVPKVDSAVVHLALYEEPKRVPLDETLFYDLIEYSFKQRRKTLYNNLSQYYDKNLIIQMIKDLGYVDAIRAEALSLDDFINMSDYLTQKTND